MGRGQQNSNNEENNTINKAVRYLSYIFCGQSDIDPVLNRSITFGTYMQIGQVARIIVLYTVFSSTNNALYHGVQAGLSGLMLGICFGPRVSNKHYILILTFIAFTVTAIAAAAILAILVENYFTFTYYCGLLSSYRQSNASFNFEAKSICQTVVGLYHLNLGTEGIVSLMRIAYLYLLLKAYGVVKRAYNEEEKRRRRKQKFDQNMKQKNHFDPYRKI